jgi:hypothetical protein
MHTALLTPSLLSFPQQQSHKRGSSVVTAALPMDAVGSDGPLAPASELVYAVSTEGFQTLECLPSIEMKDAPPLDIAMCMASPMIPEEGPGAEARQRAAAMAARVEAELRMRYVQEVAARSALRVSRLRSRKRSLDDLDLHKTLQEANAAADNQQKDKKDASPSKTKRLESGGNNRSNVMPFRRPGNAATKKVPVVTTTQSM